MRTLIKFKLFVAEIQASNSKKYKQTVLQKFKDDEDIKRYLKIAFDPYQVYGISTKKLMKEVRVGECLCPPTVFDLFEYLKEHNTGRDYDVAVCQTALEWIAQDDLESRYILEKLICKDLSIGVDAKSINAAMGPIIPCFEVMLANRYFDNPDFVKGKYFAITEKIDGGRIIAIKDNGQVSFYTRAGQKYEGLVDLEKEMLETYPDGTVIDGEITILNNKGVKSKDAYKAAMKECRKDGPKTGLKMICFDAMHIDEWKAQKSEHDYIERRMLLDGLSSAHPHTYFEVLPILYKGTDTSKITELLDEMVAQGSEGIMVNLCDAKYEFKRTNALLKCKKFQSLDLEVIDLEEGSGRLAGTLGAILVRYKGGNIVKVGSGFSDEERKLYWSQPDLILNKIVEVKFFEECSSGEGAAKTYSLRFPTWVSNIRDPMDKANPDF